MACLQSYSPNYFAINDILSSEERISCKIEVELPGLGSLCFMFTNLSHPNQTILLLICRQIVSPLHIINKCFLDSSSQSENIKVGSKLEFPLWLAESLKNLQNPVVTVQIPNIFKEGYREILEADADAVTLSKWNPYFYELGIHVQKFGDRESDQITESLLQTFKSRFRLVMDWAQNPISDPTLETQLPRLERDLFLHGRKAKVRLLEWLKMGTNSILPSEITANLKKRKRSDYELE
ncbi:DNA replication complex GINS protein PSF3 isoform X1 [Hylaeus anthracinus]|uniref:DNA replication complex GINS protein PSF3 isoform X1 n=1 Tax=Hylaeus anthracinus TaxID=313031 RepID=UPI0023B9A808|nr:DNA replication complex GINS protein PSF3 isoform X1 [Hylaeus anthracinus]